MLAQFKEIPRTAWILFVGTFVNRFGTFVMPMLAIYLTREGHSFARAGLAVGCYGGGHLCASLLGGHLADRIGRRNTIAISMSGSACAMLALSQAHAYGTIIALAFFSGLFAELYRPASYALVADLVAPEQRVFAFGLYRFAVNLGFAAGPATAGFLADRSFFYVFLGDSITSIGFLIVALIYLPNRLPASTSREKTRAPLSRAFLFLLAATVCLTLVDFQTSSTFALHVKALGYPTSTYGMLLSLNGLLIVCLELFITNYVQRMKPQPVIALGYFLSCFGFALTGLAHSVAALAATVFVWTLGEMLSSPMAGAYVASIAPPEYRGRYMGMLMMSWSVGMLAGPPLGTLTYQYNPSSVWVACAVLGCTSAALVLINREVQ